MGFEEYVDRIAEKMHERVYVLFVAAFIPSRNRMRTVFPPPMESFPEAKLSRDHRLLTSQR